MQLDPTSLRVFVSAVEEGTIAETAERERIAPAAVSKRLSELEAALHTQLFIRSNKGIKPTNAGLALINLARRVLHDMDDVYVQMREYTSGTRGYVRVFANISAITQFLPSDLHTFLTKHPHVQISIEERISTMITKAVSENAADIGLFTYGTPAHGLKTIPYREDDLVLVVPAGHPLIGQKNLSMKDILDFDFVGLHAGSWINLEVTKAAAALGRTMKLRIQVSGYDALCLMVEAGLGIGILPGNSAKPYLPTLAIKALPLHETWAHRQLAVCMRSYEELSVAARLLVDHLLVPASAQTPQRKVHGTKLYKV